MKLSAIKILRSFVLIICFYIVSCATITVNVYFPAEEVRDAYSSLEEEFLVPPTNETSDTEDTKDTVTPVQTPKPESRIIYPEEPLVSETTVLVIKREISLNFTSYAWAQGNIAAQITERIRKMPEVIDAYKRRSQRQNLINKLLSQGKISEGAEGLLIKKSALKNQEIKAVDAENKDRVIIITGMARAIVEINNLSPTPDNINKVRIEAARQFANFRRSER